MLSKALIKHINALKIKKYRLKYNEFIAEGPKIVKELIDNNITVKQVFYSEKNKNLFEQYKFAHLVESDELKKISHLSANDYQVLAICEIPNSSNYEIKHNKWYVVLDNIQDPGNMGTIIRTADWFGIDTVFVSLDCVDVFNSKTIQATMASIARVKVIEVDIATLLQTNKNIPAYGAFIDSTNLYQTKKVPGFLIIGNEGNGIKEINKQFITHEISIPRIGKTESLNAAISAGIILAWACVEH